MKKKKEFSGIDHGNNKIEIIGKELLAEMMPVEIHHKNDGTIGDKPSFCIVMKNGLNQVVIGQISLEMFNDGLKDIGYKLISLDKLQDILDDCHTADPIDPNILLVHKGRIEQLIMEE